MPALNEEKDIKHVIAALPKAIDGIDCIEHLVIDDGSTDQTAELALAAGAKVILHRRNRGVGVAFQSAVQFALENEADILVGIDADRQFDPTEIPTLIEPILTEKADMVIGNRFTVGMPANMPDLKYWGNKKIAQLVSYVSGQTFEDVSCGFRANSREALLHLNIFAQFTYTHETILSLAYQGLRIVEHPITVKYDPERKSRVAASILNYAMQTSKIVLRVMLDYRPIRVFGSLSAIFISIGIGFELFLFGHYLLTKSFSPYKATGFIGLGFIVFGMLVLIIALIADMLNRLRISQDKVLYELKKIRYDH
jgi:glycosyltransferase involved in cell wall biosynthesis